jgi:hypothetical protein
MIIFKKINIAMYLHKKQNYYLLGCLLLLTFLILSNCWEVGMITFTGFFLAYLTKGSRKITK